jgi:hypothetical protein
MPRGGAQPSILESSSAAPRALGIEVGNHLLYAVACRFRLMDAPYGSAGGAPDYELEGHDDPDWMDRRRPGVAAGAG